VGRLEDKVAVITGAARGQGEAIARAFVAEGARVLVTDVLDDLGEKLAGELGEGVASYAHLDVADPAGWAVAVEHAVREFSKVDILVNNAGVFASVPIEDQSLDDYMRIIMINQVGCWLGMKAVIPAMQANGGGVVINTSSIAGFMGAVGTSAYASSKFAVRGLTRCAAIELGPSNIRVNSVHPGLIDTDILGPARSMGDALAAGQPIRRIGRVEEVAALMVFIAADATYSTGSEFILDGGTMSGFLGGG
jgi:3alpha(or 20beta)-hydroxysteroid dehydrogenase